MLVAVSALERRIDERRTLRFGELEDAFRALWPKYGSTRAL